MRLLLIHFLSFDTPLAAIVVNVKLLVALEALPPISEAKAFSKCSIRARNVSRSPRTSEISTWMDLL